MQINRIGSFYSPETTNQYKISKPVSFGDLDYGYNGDILCVKSKSDIINNNVADKIDFVQQIKKEAKTIYKEAKQEYKEKKFSFNNIFAAKENEPVTKSISQITKEGNPRIEYVFGKGTNTFSTLTVTKKYDDYTQEYNFNNNKLVSYNEYNNNSSLEKSVTLTRGNGFVYSETENKNGAPKIVTSIIVTGLRGNKNSTFMTYENGEKQNYIYNAKTNKWTLIQR